MSRNPIKDKPSMTDHIADAMHENWPSYSIDSLLCHPVEAMEMAIEVAMRSERVNATRVKQMRRALDAFGKSFGHELDAVNEICRAGMTARKAGELKRDRV